MIEMDVELAISRKVKILGLDYRKSEDELIWCSSTMEVSKLFWVSGYLICMEVPEKSFEHEIETGEFIISQLCFTKCPKYERFKSIARGGQIPVVDMSSMKLFQEIAKVLATRESST
ncbi:MAG: hypothetical protein QXV76_00870 [Candidatus Bathyarchaeia archaeon]